MTRRFLALFLLCVGATVTVAQTQLTIKSSVLNEARTVLVRTPPGYEQNGLRYPVLYMTDGAAHLAHTVATIEFLTRNGRMPELIVVAITNTDRTRDLTPTKASLPRPNGEAIQFPTSGGADNFLKFIATELIPKVESSYRTEPFRIFAGHSFGGLLALHTFLSRPELFNAYIAVSPTMHWDNHLVSRRAEEFFKARKELKRTLYFTLANEGGEAKVGFEHFQKILSQQNTQQFAWGASLMEDEDHGSVVMRSHYQGLRKIFDGWLLAADSATGNILGSHASLEAHYKKLSTRYGFNVQPPEALINQLGYQLMGEKKMEEAIAVFKANVERYPNSANVYDSLAEAFETMGQLELARTSYEKAMQLGQKNNDPAFVTYKTNFERVAEQLKKKVAAKEQ